MATNKFFSGFVKRQKGHAKIPSGGNANVVIIPVSNDGNYETVPGNKGFDGFSIHVSPARDMYARFYREREQMEMGVTRSKMVGAGTDYCLASCYEGDKFSFELFEKALKSIAKDVIYNKSNIHWNACSIPKEYDDKIQALIEREFLTYGINIYIYE